MLLEHLESAQGPFLFQMNQRTEPPISKKAERILAEMSGIEGNDSVAKEQTQRLLWHLAGELCTERLTISLRSVLKRRGWKVRCPHERCGVPASFTWARSQKCVVGGRLQIYHQAPGEKQINHAAGKLPRLDLE